MSRLLAVLAVIAILVVVPSAWAQGPPPDPLPQDCPNTDIAACDAAFIDCVPNCEGKDGNYYTCYYGRCTDEYWGCIYGGLVYYWTESTISSDAGGWCAEFPGDPYSHYATLHHTDTKHTLHRRQECYEGPTYTITTEEYHDISNCWDVYMLTTSCPDYIFPTVVNPDCYSRL